MFFFEKKNQKTFDILRARWMALRARKGIKVFCFFSSEKKNLSFLATRERQRMGIVEQIMSGMMGGGDVNTSRLQGVLMGLLGTGNAAGQLAGEGPQPGEGVLGGGLRGLVGLFEQNGLGPVVQSWVGNGPNATVTPADLQHVFGGARVDAMAAQAGMPAHDLLEELARHLPGLVDGMTPEGHLPAP